MVLVKGFIKMVNYLQELITLVEFTAMHKDIKK